MGDPRGTAVLERVSGDGSIRVDTRAPRDTTRDRRRALTLVLLTIVLPGSAQLAAGNRALGRFALRVWLGVLAALVLLGLLFLVSREAALTVAAHRWTLAGAEWLLFGLSALWLVLLVDARSGELLRDLTPGPFDAPTFSLGGDRGFDFSPDSKELVFVSNHERLQAESTNADVWIVPVEGGAEPRNLTDANDGWDGAPLFSPVWGVAIGDETHPHPYPPLEGEG